MEQFKSTYSDWFLISGLLLSMGGTTSYALCLTEKTLLAFILFFILLIVTICWWFQVFEYNMKLEEKKPYYVDGPFLNASQKDYFTLSLREDLNSDKKRIFYFREHARKIFYHYENKLTNNIALSKEEQYILNLILIEELDLCMAYFRFQEVFDKQCAMDTEYNESENIVL
ncbi:hypothetical protein [Evansella cellulosilytica]|uniref:Uncharacterized protein n=1 Tax=Evansella cellulosilytica (strain ATCC 21833 / DSM 2522 / FERM P-1141 / JCM 9156 / N-4) TaxID=649639 RepID=E6TR60_EVAC2|nr:hypothetical protein [Evansella cellulosilytica]ADU30572.1 hypothetical protein Bcell_2312 [Evansella cellulosilytica DSM 2522]